MTILIAGATASGKSSLAVRVAKQLNAEIISADSMQIYQKMDIGTAKVTLSEQCGIPHHGLNLVSPDADFSVAEYVEYAKNKVFDIQNRGKTAVFVGGTGLYLRSLVQPMDFGNAEKDDVLRQQLVAEYNQHGALHLHQLLTSLAPERAKEIHPNNVKRVIRAIEIAKCGQEINKNPTECVQSVQPPLKNAIYFVLELPRELLYQRINCRVDQMICNGLQNEVASLLQQGITFQHQSMQAIGYKEWAPHFVQGASVESVTEKIKQNSRNYAKRQVTWFKKEQDAIFIDGTQDSNVLAQNIVDYYKNSVNLE